MPRPRNTETRRQQIVDGMLEVLADNSYERATIASIARAAGLTSGLVHYHFSSKQAILLALVEQLAEKLQARYRALASHDDPLARLDAYLDSRLSLGTGADRSAVACWVAIGTEALRQSEVATVYQDFMLKQRAELEELLSPLCPDPEHSRRGAAALLAVIEGSYQLATSVPGLLPEGTAAASVKAMARGLIQAQSRG